jgi:GAF domain-containing protein
MNTMEKSAEVTAIEKKLDDILATLLRESQGSRCTLRIDDPVRNWNVDFICAEATRPGVKSLRGDGSINQRAAATVQWLAAQKRNLVQPDLTGNPNPAPPPALMSAYAAKAQMLAPLLAKDGHLSGWISVHYVDGTHVFTADEERALDRAQVEVARLTGIGA